MEVLSPSPLTSPYISSPRSPTHLGGGNDHHHLYYSSAPTSPSRVADFYRSFNNFSFNNRNHDQAQDQDGNTHHHDDDDDKDKEEEQEEDDFAFDFSGQVSKTSLSADELFDGGKIRPIQLDNNNIGAEEEARIRRPRSPNESPRGRRKDLNPFVNSNDQERGRERVVSVFTSAARSSRRVTRSLSPYRTTDLAWEEDHQQQQQQQSTKPTSSNSKSSSKKWRLRDFLLFRSASEGRATSKYSVVTKKGEELRGSKGVRSNDGPVSRRRGPVSAHELHYKSNRAVSEEMKRRTFLPYKQGLFGWFTRG